MDLLKCDLKKSDLDQKFNLFFKQLYFTMSMNSKKIEK